MAPHATRSQKDVPPPASIPLPSSRPQPSSQPRALPTTNDDKRRLLGQFQRTYDDLEKAKDDLLRATGKAYAKAGNAFDANLVSNLVPCCW